MASKPPTIRWISVLGTEYVRVIGRSGRKNTSALEHVEGEVGDY